jgi:osmotically-inducible protein OsmY
MSRIVLAALLGTAVAPWPALAQNVVPLKKPATAIPLETAIAQALRNNPITGPYAISVTAENRQIVLKGRVGNKQVHDIAVRTAIDFGASIRDDLIIDTTSSVPISAPVLVSSYTYPPPLFGRFDDSFYGLEPPLITYPANWAEISQRRAGASSAPLAARSADNAAPLPPNTVEMTIDPLGVASIRGTVPSETDKTNIAKHLLQIPGVNKVLNNLTVDPSVASTQAPAPPGPDDDTPPPFPTPAIVVPKDAPMNVPKPPKPGPVPPQIKVEKATVVPKSNDGVNVSLKDGIATISGNVANVYEAMLAYRRVEKTPGVRSIIDMLTFVVPDGESPNPLIDKGQPDEVEPYLEAQLRRQLGDIAHIDRVRMSGKQLQVKGTITNPDDRTRVEAILRSMPILRGFAVLPEFQTAER